jgi:hypothetical protein
MRLSRKDTELLLRKYAAPDASPVVAVLLSSSRIAKVDGRLSLEPGERGLVIKVTPECGEGISFPLGLVRAVYTDTFPVSPEDEEALKARFEGALSLISNSGERLYILEPKRG